MELTVRPRQPTELIIPAAGPSCAVRAVQLAVGPTMQDAKTIITVTGEPLPTRMVRSRAVTG